VVTSTEHAKNTILKAQDSYIWDIAVLHLATNATFCRKVDPGLKTYPPPPTSELFHVTEAYLKEQRAVPFGDVIAPLMAFLCKYTGGTKPTVFISHGTFLLDKPVLELEFARHNTLIPNNLYFFDTLPYFRRVFRRQPSYSLKSLYKSVFPTRPFVWHHFAVSDVLYLRGLLFHACGGNLHTIEGCMCPAYLTPLQTVKFIGHQKERLLFNSGISCVEELVLICTKKCFMNENAMCNFLEEFCKIERASALKVARQVLFTVIKQCVRTNY